MNYLSCFMKKGFTLWLFLFFCLQHYSRAQNSPTCNWYEIYKEDFGGGPSSPAMGPPLPAGLTTYEYTTHTPVEDGFYGIRKQVRGHGPTESDSWHQITDHTGGGYMMVVNADYDPGLFYRAEIEGLCQGTSFRFSSWVANLMKPSRGGHDPILKFVILNGSTEEVIKEYNTGELGREENTAAVWKEYGVSFDLPAGLSSVILEIYNDAPGGSGNDLALDDITFSICGPEMVVDHSHMFNGGKATCLGGEIELEAVFPGDQFSTPEYRWQFSENNEDWVDLGEDQTHLSLSNVSSADSGWYRLLASEQGNIDLENCRITSDADLIKVMEPPRFEIESNAPVCEGSELHLSIPETSLLETNWTGPNDFQSNEKELLFEKVSLNHSGIYQVEVVNEGGCEVSQSKTIAVQENEISLSFKDVPSILCEGDGDPIVLDATNPNAQYRWNTGATTPTLSVNAEGFYKVEVQQDACTASDSIQIHSLASPAVDLGADTTICYGEAFFLRASDSSEEEYLWNDGSTDSLLEIITPGDYSVVLTNYCGTAEDRIHIEMEDCLDRLLFPSAFTPNGDGQNDIFKPKVFFRLSDYELLIFDRWGHEVFHSKDPDTGWDGRLNNRDLPVGSYVWVVQYVKEKDNEAVSEKGSITLLR